MLLPFLIAAALVQDPAPPLYALVPQDESRHFRRVVRIDPTSGTREVLLEDLLYCFDAADLQELWPQPGGGLVAAGPVSAHRPSPNVSMPLWVLGAGRRTPDFLSETSLHYALSADGRWLADAGSFRLRLMDLQDEEPSWLPLAEPEESSPSPHFGAPLWSPDSAWLYVSARAYRSRAAEHLPQQPGLWRFPAGGGAPRKVADLGGARLLAVEPSGRGILAHAKVGRDPRAEGWIERIDLEGGETTLLVDDAASRQLAFDLAPGGDRMVYGRRDRQLVLREADGSSQLLGPGRHPRFSPDGRWLAYHQWQEGMPELWLLELESGQRRSLGRGEKPVWGHPAVAAAGDSAAGAASDSTPASPPPSRGSRKPPSGPSE